VDNENEEMQDLVDQALKSSKQIDQEDLPTTPDATIEPEKEKTELDIEVDLKEEINTEPSIEASFDEESTEQEEPENQPEEKSHEEISEEIVDNQTREEENTTSAEEDNGTTSQIPSTENEISSNQSYLINEYFNRGLSAAEKRKYDEAIDAFTKVTNLLPDAAPSFLNLAIVHFRMRNFEEALHFNQKAIDRGSDPAKRLQAKIEAEFNKIA